MEFAMNSEATLTTTSTSSIVSSIEDLELVDQIPSSAPPTEKLLNSTSTVMVSDTIANPNFDQVLFCISAIIQAQIYEDEEATIEDKKKHPEFDLQISLPTELGGVYQCSSDMSDSLLRHETVNDDCLRQKILEGSVPTVDTIFRFIYFIYDRAKYSAECNIITLIYINRLTSAANRTPLTMGNWRGIWLGAVLLAQKVWDDAPLKTSSFINILPSVDKKSLKKIEMKAFVLMEYLTGVKPALYAKYYFELRQLFIEIMGSAFEQEWTMKPLSVVQAKQLINRTNKINARKEYYKIVGSKSDTKYNGSHKTHFQGLSMKKRPQTLEDVTIRDTSLFVIS